VSPRVLIALATLALGCEQEVRAVPLAERAPPTVVEPVADMPAPERTIADLLTIEVPEDVERRERGTETSFSFGDGRALSVREIGDARVAGRRAEYTAQFELEPNEPPLLCRLADREGTPELIGDVVLCGRSFEVRCTGGEAPEMGVSGFWCVSHLATLRVDRETPRGRACPSAPVALADAPRAVQERVAALSIARTVRTSGGSIELGTTRPCGESLVRGGELALYAPDAPMRRVAIWEVHHTAADRCDVRIRVAQNEPDSARALFLVAPVESTARPSTAAAPLPFLPDDLDVSSWGRYRHDFDLDGDRRVDAIVRSGDAAGAERMLILDAEAGRWYVRAPGGDVG
jgi:hypothetical protein